MRLEGQKQLMDSVIQIDTKWLDQKIMYEKRLMDELGS